MKRIIEPNIGDIVYTKKDNALIPIKILNGSFFRNGRVSNFWKWLNLVSGEVEEGYGIFWRKESEEEE